MDITPEDNRCQDELDQIGGLRCDFSIVAGHANRDFASRLHLDLNYIGLSSIFTISALGPEQYLKGAWQTLQDHRARARVLVIVYSESELQSFLSDAWRQPKALHALFDEFFGVVGWLLPVVFVVVEGDLPVPVPSGIPVVDAVVIREVKVVENYLGGNVEIIDRLYECTEKYLIGRRDADTRLRDLRGRIRSGIEGAAKLGGAAIMVFGPAKPKAVNSQSKALGQEHELLWALREGIRASAEELGVAAIFGEHLDGVGQGELQAGLNPDLKEKLCSRSCEYIVVIAGSHGASAEIGAFGQLEDLARKMLIVIGEDKRAGYVASGAIKTAELLGAQVVWYSLPALAHGEVRSQVFEIIKPVLERALQRAIVKASTQLE